MADDNIPTSSKWSSGWLDDGWQGDAASWWTCDPTYPGNQSAWGPGGVSSGDTWWWNNGAPAGGFDDMAHCQIP
eukprot:2135124-Pyramimonas_sp.AAC.1